MAFYWYFHLSLIVIFLHSVINILCGAITEKNFAFLIFRERDRDRERDTHTLTDRQTKTERDRQTKRERKTKGEGERHRQKDKDREREGETDERQTDKQIGRQIQREKDVLFQEVLIELVK